jgi:hypothetical protein
MPFGGEGRMRHKLLCFLAQIVLLATMVPAAEGLGLRGPQGKGGDLAGSWKGSYTQDDGNSGTLGFVFTRAEKRQYRGSIAWSSGEGEQKADLGLIQLIGGKVKCSLESPDGVASITVEGQLSGDQFNGTFAVYRKGTTDAMQRGTWKVTRVK